MKDKTKAKIKVWVNFLYTPAMIFAGWTKNKLDNFLIPVVKSVLDKILSPKP